MYSLWSNIRIARAAALIDRYLCFGMCGTYLRRFTEIEIAWTEGNDLDVKALRTDQQDEWNRLSTLLAFEATMQAAILAINPQPPPLAFAIWLGALGLSSAGLFTINVFPIKAFSLTDEEIFFLIRKGEDTTLMLPVVFLGCALAAPTIISLWSAVLFTVGVFVYIVQCKSEMEQHLVVAVVPVVVGVIAAVATGGLVFYLEQSLSSVSKRNLGHFTSGD
ncbi:hypothetical protein H0H81_010557 [Sphagnurus paluster]|uniref:Uncharacterized protein n=1 Tax=Sphagnurus paluster TaxID=117069 RepID=A0A9P7FUB4_9AGAR|nr:hypothetical protein H0H81_010557 [Sphagnurus paluster]